MDIEGPDAGRKIAGLLLAFAHLCWAGLLAFAVWVGYLLADSSDESFVVGPEVVLLVAGVVTAATAGVVILRGPPPVRSAGRWNVVAATVVHGCVGAAVLWSYLTYSPTA